MLYEMLASTTDRHPGQFVIESSGGTTPYTRLLSEVDQFASDLVFLGIGEEDPVILLLPNGVEFVVAMFAVARLGGILVPLNPAFQTKELRFYLEDSRAKAVVATRELASRHRQLIEETNAACQIITSVPRAAEPPPSADTSRRPFDGTFLYQYSSGSTGVPKRVVRTQSNLIHEANNYTSTVQLTADDRILTVVPLFHAHGFGNCLLASTRVGATMITLPAFNRQGALDALTQQNTTVFPGVPFMFSILADSPSLDGVELPHVRLAFSAGAPLAGETFRDFQDKFGIQIKQLYGATETGAVAINLGPTTGDRWASVGKPLNGVEVRLVRDDGETAAANETGEILICSQAMTEGYANLDMVNRESFREGDFWSGDLGRIDDEGNLFITGRKRLFINAGGNKVDPAEIEAILSKHSAVQECVVLGVKGQYGGEIIKAAVVLREECSVNELKEWCRGEVADFKVPRIFDVRDEIPRSPLGKILRKYLQ